MSYSFSPGRAVLWVKLYRSPAVENEVYHQWMLHKGLTDSSRATPSVYFTLMKMPLQLGWWWSSAGFIGHNQLPSGMLWDCVFCIYCLRTIWRDWLQDLHHKPPPASTNTANTIRDPPVSVEDPSAVSVTHTGMIFPEVKSREHSKLHFVNSLLLTALDFKGTPDCSGWRIVNCSVRN